MVILSHRLRTDVGPRAFSDQIASLFSIASCAGLTRGFGGCSAARFCAALLALADTGRFAAPFAQVVELGAANLAAAHDLDRVDRRRIERKHTLDAFPVGNLAHREVLIEPATRPTDAHTLIGLYARTVAFDHLHVHQHGIAGPEIGDFLAGGKLRHLLFFELLNYVHGYLRRQPLLSVPADGKEQGGVRTALSRRLYDK